MRSACTYALSPAATVERVARRRPTADRAVVRRQYGLAPVVVRIAVVRHLQHDDRPITRHIGMLSRERYSPAMECSAYFWQPCGWCSLGVARCSLLACLCYCDPTAAWHLNQKISVPIRTYCRVLSFYRLAHKKSMAGAQMRTKARPTFDRL